MYQDGQTDLLTRGQPIDSPGLLQVVLLSYNNKGERTKDGDRYAAISFPQSYEDAMSWIQQSLGRYLKGGPKGIDSVDILCPMFNIDNEWIWAEADKKDWDLVVHELLKTRKILAIRQRNASEAEDELDVFFTRGPVILACGTTTGGLTSWTEVPTAQNRRSSLTQTINRPVSYKDAIDLIVKGAKAQTYASKEYGGIKAMNDLTQIEFKFYYFVYERGGLPCTDAWVDFPVEAYTDDRVWRAIVPKVHHLLGYTLHPKM